jgi:hypothetical protein
MLRQPARAARAAPLLIMKALGVVDVIDGVTRLHNRRGPPGVYAFVDFVKRAVSGDDDTKSGGAGSA